MAKKVINSRLLGILGGPKYGPIEGLVKTLCKMYGFQSDFGVKVMDDPRLELEKVMTLLSVSEEVFDRKIMYPFPSEYPLDPLKTLIELIAITLNEALMGPSCEKHKELVKSMSGGDLVISYNYDLLLDNALYDVDGFSDAGYFVEFYKKLESGRWVRPGERKSEITLLKLHGSMNWLRCEICGSNLLLRGQKFVSPYLSSIIDKCPRCEAGKEKLQRLMVPPLLNKDYHDRNINYLWLTAERLFRNIQRVVVIGYSLPATDFASETLLRRGVSLRLISTEVPLIVINPDDEVALRFAAIFNSSEISKFENLDQWLISLHE